MVPLRFDKGCHIVQPKLEQERSFPRALCCSIYHDHVKKEDVQALLGYHLCLTLGLRTSDWAPFKTLMVCLMLTPCSINQFLSTHSALSRKLLSIHCWVIKALFTNCWHVIITEESLNKMFLQQREDPSNIILIIMYQNKVHSQKWAAHWSADWAAHWAAHVTVFCID